MAEWLAFMPGSCPGRGAACLEFVRFLWASWVPSGYSGFLQYTKDTLKLPSTGTDTNKKVSWGALHMDLTKGTKQIIVHTFILQG